MYILRSAPKLKNMFFPLTATFYNFTLKLETSWTKKVVKSILETWNFNDVIVYVWFIYFWIKKNRNMQCKKDWFQMHKI